MSTPARLREVHLARNNARVRTKSKISARFFVAIVLLAASGCSSQAEDFVTKIRSESTEKCNDGNQAACHTVVQAISETKVVIENTAPIETLTSACNAGTQDACEQVAVLHSELSTWCSMGNNQACAAVNIGPWPAKWDEPALIDAAKLSCLGGKFKPESNTCQALQMM